MSSYPNKTLIEPHEGSGVRDIDFDLIEIINPSDTHYEERIKALRQDWLSLVKQGEKIVATANSDSHGAHEQVAMPRTMVAMQNDRVPSFKQNEFLKALKKGDAYGSTGPMLEISLSGTKMGDTFSGGRGQLLLDVSSASWAAFDKIEVQVNGTTIDQYTIRQSERDANTLHHRLLVPLEFNKDSFVTVEVSGKASEAYQNVYPGLAPYAYSNPIYVDFDSDGQWTPPGL